MNRNDSRRSWTIAPSECEVQRLAFDWAVGVELVAGDDRYYLRIESPFVLQEGSTESLVVPEIPSTAGALLLVLRQKVVELEMFDEGHLEMQLSQSRISVPGTEDYEPWELTGPNGLRVVSIPGGELAVWLPTSERLE
jgi:hypothetical protein